MTDFQNSWWEEEVNETFQILKKYIYLSMAIILLVWSLSFLFYDKTFPVFVAPFIGIHTMTFLIVKFLKNKKAIYKAISSLLYAELASLALFYHSLFFSIEHKILFEMLACLIVKHLELPFIQQIWLKNLIYGRHIVLWYYINSFPENLNYIQNLSIYMTILYIFIIFNLISYLRLRASQERFIYWKELEKAESRLGIVINGCPDGILVISRPNKIEYFNPNILRLLSCSKEEVISLLQDIEYTKDKKYSTLTNSNRLIDDIQFIFNYEFNHEVMLGISMERDINIEWKATKILWENKKVALIIYAKNANQIIQLEQTNAENKIKTVLLRSVSHELRTPINAILFLAKELLEELRIVIDECQIKKIEMILVSSKLLLSLVNDLLDYSRMLAGVFSIQKSKFRIRELVSSTSDLIKLQAQKKNLELNLRFDPDLPEWVYTDPLRLSQAILNLLSNALKFTMKGSIEICCLMTAEEQLKLVVNDTGIGIPDDKLLKLFEEFSTSNTANINPQGCGLGLHITNRIVKELEGTCINVSSQPGKGSTFSFAINAFDSNNSPSSFQEEDSDYTIEEEKQPLKVIQFFTYNDIRNRYPKVLIVDDNDFNRIILGSLLTRNEILYNEACNGKEAVECVMTMDNKDKPYYVVIMDCSMPELDGWEATKVIHEKYEGGRLRRVPWIIGYSAFSSSDDVKKCYESGMTECLVKPCSSEVIIETIQKYLNRLN
ncbi:unnamed protein product [Blepharisma stoltei]|uniref:histidine kinase n=1 Tax=Blepharisma stoltei TaxID=1481888 RepID=A0AAU9I9Q0_9CILI|nr:unnamed protein product [Blepharisma stoltei]